MINFRFCIAFTLLTLVAGRTTGFAQRLQDLDGAVVTHQPASTKKYIGSPSLAILPDGVYVASHDFFGPESSEWVQAVTHIYQSGDKGKSWQRLAEIDGAFWSKLFVHRNILYLIGPDRHHGTLLIRKSEDGGKTWTKPVNRENGLLLAGEFHCAPTPVIEYDNRLWRAMETAHGPVRQWGRRYGAFMMSAPADADLLRADSWRSSNMLPFDSTLLNGSFTGWLEGNAVVAPDSGIVNILRVDDKTTLEEKAAIVRIDREGKTASFNPSTGFLPFPGGSKKFTIRYDPVSKIYWSLVNYIPSDIKALYPRKNPASIRNTMALAISRDLKRWDILKVLLQHPDVEKHGFQYVDWQFEGEDIIWLCRTAAEDGMGGARNNHDANFLTFHRIKAFRKLLK